MGAQAEGARRDDEALPGLVLQASPPEPAPARTDPVSVAALVTGIVGLAPVAVALGVVGLVRTKRAGVGGRRLAVTGIALGMLWGIGFLTVFVFAVLLGQRVASSVQGLDEPEIGSGVVPGDPSTVTKAASEVEQGDCVLAWDPTVVTGDVDPDVVVVTCTTPHQAQALARVDLSAGYPASAGWPGVAALTTRGTGACSSSDVAVVALTAAGGGASLTAIPPTVEAWASGARAVTCLLVATGPTLAESFAP
jgi:hypothetical protein